MTKNKWIKLSKNKKEEYKLLFGDPILNGFFITMTSFFYAGLTAIGFSITTLADYLFIKEELMRFPVFSCILGFCIVMMTLFVIIVDLQEKAWISKNT